MQSSWVEILDNVLKPARPRLDSCLVEREHHLGARRAASEIRSLAIRDCERRIEAARAAVFASADGVVGSLMTDLEREWRRLSRPDHDAGMMDLWARVAPARWIDRKRWQDAPPEARLDAAIALASDAENVEAAEAAIDALRVALSAFGTRIGTRIRWRPFSKDVTLVSTLLSEPFRCAREACPERFRGRLLERAGVVEQTVREAARARLGDRSELASDIAHAAAVEFVARTAAVPSVLAVVDALRALWKTGYVLSEVDERTVTLEIPTLALAN
jgi:hypothetical protein